MGTLMELSWWPAGRDTCAFQHPGPRRRPEVSAAPCVTGPPPSLEPLLPKGFRPWTSLAWGSMALTPSPEEALPLGSRWACLCPCEARAASCKEKAEKSRIQLKVLIEDFLCSAPSVTP